MPKKSKSPAPRKPLVESILVTTFNDDEQALKVENLALQQKVKRLSTELTDCRERLRVMEARRDCAGRQFQLECSQLLFEQLLVSKCIEKEQPYLLDNRFVRALTRQADRITTLLQPFIQEHKLAKRFARQARRIKEELEPPYQARIMQSLTRLQENQRRSRHDSPFKHHSRSSQREIASPINQVHSPLHTLPLNNETPLQRLTPDYYPELE